MPGYRVAELLELGGFLFGLLLGSFLNVCIARLPAHQSIVAPRSRCPHCSHPIRWYDNIPLLSWLLLRARCRDCKAPISWRYPAVELATGIWMASAAARLFEVRYALAIDGWVLVPEETVKVIALAVLGLLLIGLMVMDWQTQRLPDAFTISGIGLGFLLTCVQAFFLVPGEGDVVMNDAHQLRLSSPGSFTSQGNIFMTGSEALIWGRILAIAIAALVPLLIRVLYRALRKRDGIGMGDVKLMAMIAAFLGLADAALSFLVGVLAAALYALFLLARRRANAETRLPLGSFLCAGGLFAARFGTQIVGWYIGLFH